MEEVCAGRWAPHCAPAAPGCLCLLACACWLCLLACAWQDEWHV